MGELDQHAMLEALAALLQSFATGTADDFGRWEPMREVRPGVQSMPYVTYGDLEAAFRRATGGWVRPDIDWTTWAGTVEGQALQRDPDAIAGATSEDLAHLLTTLIRGDRFHECLVLDAFERGNLAAIARRAAALAAALTAAIARRAAALAADG